MLLNQEDETLKLINFEVQRAPEDSDATIALSWHVENAVQVTIVGPGAGPSGLNSRTIYGSTGELHINTTETKVSYKLTAAPDHLRLIHGNCEIDLNSSAANGAESSESASAGSAKEEKVIDPDATAVRELGLKGIETKKGVCYVEYKSKQTLEWAYQNGDAASFMVKGDIPGIPQGNLAPKGTTSVGSFTAGTGGTIELLVTKPSRASKTLNIRISRAQISVTNAEVEAGGKATLSWDVKSAEAIEITPFKGTGVEAPDNPDFSGSMTFEVQNGNTYEFKVHATSSDGKTSHKIMKATVAGAAAE